MKKVLLGTTALLLSAGVAAAEVAVSGEGRMGIVDALGDDTDAGFSSRIRIAFSASGETDAGLSFGGSIRADNAGGGEGGTAGNVFVEGTFGKISMGDVGSAADAANGDVSGVGYTNPGAFNEFVYLGNDRRPAARWDYVMGGLGLHISSDNPSSDLDTTSVAVTYSAGALSIGLGYEDAEVDLSNSDGDAELAGLLVDGLTFDGDHIIGSVAYAFGDATVKAVYGTASGDLNGTITGTAITVTDAEVDFSQMGVSVDYVVGATTLTAYYAMYEIEDDIEAELTAIGVGASYDLGGGASLAGGFVSTSGEAFGVDYEDEDAFDLGINMTF